MRTGDSDELGLLREALSHLYDPAYVPPEALCQFLMVETRAVRETLIQAIRDLEPGKEVPLQTRAWRIYDLLYYRFVKGLTQDETAALLGLTPRHIRREQGEALRVLAERLGKQRARPPAPEPSAREVPGDNGATVANERTQVRREMAALQESAPEQISHVAEVMERAAYLAGSLLADAPTCLQLVPPAAELCAAIHPSALRQLLIHLLAVLADGGEMTLSAVAEGDWVAIRLTTGRPICGQVLEDSLISEILAATAGVIQQAPDDPTALRILLPRALGVRVLLVDDNLDLVHVYRRYTAGTRYELIHTSRGSDVYQLVEQQSFDVIVLDVMLPDVDGWEVLSSLRQHPLGRRIPVIICSVVREQELALSLGAAVFIAKPVRPQQFLQALSQALQTGTAGHEPPDVHSATPH